jgi:hypothetical protein
MEPLQELMKLCRFEVPLSTTDAKFVCYRTVPVDVYIGRVFDPIWIKSVMTNHSVPMTMTPDPGVTGVVVFIVVIVVIVVDGG